MEEEKLNKVHFFGEEIKGVPLPEKFTYPFYYVPHPLCKMAASEVQRYVDRREDWKDELQNGKMFGVLVVRTKNGSLGYLAAFSGNLANTAHHDFFVPPVYDLEVCDEKYKEIDAVIVTMSKNLDSLMNSSEYLALKEKVKSESENMNKILFDAREEMKKAKTRRDVLRKTKLTDEELQRLIQESQFQKAEYKRLQERLQKDFYEIRQELDDKDILIAEAKSVRKVCSVYLQTNIFQKYIFLNAKGESKKLVDIFKNESLLVPPSGAGECAAPRLLQYAFLNHLQPVAMAEFWWGGPSKKEIRIPGCYYPACKGKCGPILGWMLQGLDVEDNLLDRRSDGEIQVIYEDEWMMAVNKPEGLLSIPGKSQADSVSSQILKMRPDVTGPLIVHRLDMAASGLMLIAKNKEIHKLLQEMFLRRKIKKTYVALLNGVVDSIEGEINLPMCPDYLNRPRQIVSKESGKDAITHYKVLEINNFQTRVELSPYTGRTHQLRVHAACKDGLNAPILGDNLYGDMRRSRLYLHAQSLDFIHPMTGMPVHLKIPADF